MPRLLAAITLFLAASSMAASARADIVAHISLSRQVMTVQVNGRVMHRWPVSTARKGYRTPVGNFRPIRLNRVWHSSIYNDSPMPYSVFFKGGYAIHGTNYVGHLGRPASHGCVRLHTVAARQLFHLIQRHGAANARIRITG